MTPFTPQALATGIGSLPHTDPKAALAVIFKQFPDIPFWPQLPRRDFRENMYAQFSERLPSVQIDLAHEWMGAVIGDDLLTETEDFYARYLNTEDLSAFATHPEYASGLYALCEEPDALRAARWIKGQVTGPISFGLRVTDQNLRPILYDDTLRDVLVKHLARKAQWHEAFLAALGPSGGASPRADGAPWQGSASSVINFIDEPSLGLIGASVVALNHDEVVRDLEEVYAGLRGLKATHCCGNTDWSLLLQTSVDIISFDAYNYAENLALFADDVKRFLDRGGSLAWGIVPTVEEQIAGETAEHLAERLDAAIGLLVKKGIDRDLLYERALITPACGLGTISVPSAERALALTSGVSQLLRRRLVF